MPALEGAASHQEGCPSRLGVKLAASFGELAGLFFQTLLQRLGLTQALFGGVCEKCGFDSLPGRGAP
jgi:hypothetical protein